jgi:hypothetical protein
MNLKAFTSQLVELHLTGKLNRNTPESNRQAIREYLARNDYWTFGAEHIEGDGGDYDQLADLMAAALGMSPDQFASDDQPFIEPKLTAVGLLELRHRLEQAAAAHQRVVFATNHPGSLLGFYAVFAREFARAGGQVVALDAPVEAPERRWLDEAAGVVMLSDEGNLMHAHTGNGFGDLLGKLKPDLVVADHGFAMDAINAGCHVIAIFDVDDPALAVAAHSSPDRVYAFPMNDNQTNIRSSRAAEATWEAKGA